MMGLAKMAPDGWADYAREIAAGENYFAGHSEEKGRWMGWGAEALGLAGETDPEALSRYSDTAVTRRPGPRWTVRSCRTRQRWLAMPCRFRPRNRCRSCGALATSEVVPEVRAGHDVAVAVALEFLQDHAAFTRRGHGGYLSRRGCQGGRRGQGAATGLSPRRRSLATRCRLTLADECLRR